MATRSAYVNSEPGIADLGALAVGETPIVDLKILAEAGKFADTEALKVAKSRAAAGFALPGR